MTDVIAILSREHANITALVKALEENIDRFELGEKIDFDILTAIAEYFLSFPDLYHHPKEDLVFAKLKERDPAAVEKIGNLREEHEEIARRTREFANGVAAILGEAQVPRDSFSRWARNFIEQQRNHVVMEERHFFPAAQAALTAEDWAEIEEKMQTPDDPLFGDDVAEPFEILREDILRWHKETI
jgi:hemerythrin-like domain-containing protein